MMIVYLQLINRKKMKEMLKGIMAIAGQPGLFKLIAETKNRIIVESLLNGKRMAAGTTSKISSLDDIAIFTHAGDIPLRDIFRLIHTHENGGPAIDAKSADNELRRYFSGVVPDYDQEKVYLSDIKKVILWYNLLQGKDMLQFPEEKADEADAAAPEGTESE